MNTFLVEGQRRIIAHSQELLAAGDLSRDDRNRLLRLLNEAERELGRLTLAEAA